MKLSIENLKTGYVVENSEGNKGCIMLGDFEIIQWEDGTWEYLEEQIDDIVKVSRPIQAGGMYPPFKNMFLSVIWERHTFTEEEIIILKALDSEYKYIARDFDDELWVFFEKPYKRARKCWDSLQRCEMLPMSRIFRSISKDDEEPVCIADVLKV